MEVIIKNVQTIWLIVFEHRKEILFVVSILTSIVVVMIFIHNILECINNIKKRKKKNK